MKPTMGSLFAGIGGFDLGFQRAGFDVKWQVEYDAWCCRVLAKNFPNAERHHDIREIRSAILGPVDVVCAGFPCQDISYAGLGAGIDGERSGLVSDAIRLVAELRPKFFLLENVAALLTRGLPRVLGLLAEIGYDAEWEVVSATDAIQTDHLRERVWILAYPNGDGCTQRDNDSRNGGQENGEKHSRSENLGAFATEKTSNPASGEFSLGRKAGRIGRFGERIPWDRTWKITYQPTLDRAEDGIPNRLDRLRGLGNAVVPQIPEMYARRIKFFLENA